MATRSLATRMCTPAASALRHRLGPGMPAAARSRFVDTIHSQNGNAARKFSSVSEESARAILEYCKKQEEATRRFKRDLRTLKFMKWTLNMGISVTPAAMVVRRVTRV